MSAPEHLGMQEVEEEDALQYGVKGMKWGVRRSKAQLDKSKDIDTPDDPSHRPGGSGYRDDGTPYQTHYRKDGTGYKKYADGKRIELDAPKSDGPETSAQRYTRLRETAKSGKASGLSDEDLKWFNARTEALSKINKLNATNPGWLKKTLDEVTKNVAKQQIETVAKALANKHISDPLVEKITEKQKKATEEAIKKGVEEALKKQMKALK